MGGHCSRHNSGCSAEDGSEANHSIPIHDTLDRILKIGNRDQSTILVTAYGQPFSVKGFGNMVSSAIHEAGLPERCKPHGLRKAAARRLAETDCSANEIAAITGHKTLAEVERYTRQTRCDRPTKQLGSRWRREVANRLFDQVANDGSDALENRWFDGKAGAPPRTKLRTLM